MIVATIEILKAQLKMLLKEVKQLREKNAQSSQNDHEYTNAALSA